MQCKRCGHDVNATDRFCSRCAEPVPTSSAVYPVATPNKTNENTMIVLSIVGLGLLGVFFLMVTVPYLHRERDLPAEVVSQPVPVAPTPPPAMPVQSPPMRPPTIIITQPRLVSPPFMRPTNSGARIAEEIILRQQEERMRLNEMRQQAEVNRRLAEENARLQAENAQRQQPPMQEQAPQPPQPPQETQDNPPSAEERSEGNPQ